MTVLVLETDRRDGVVSLTLNRPDKKNALSVALRDALSDTLDRLAGDEAARAVTLTGDTFSAGFDLAEFEVDDPEFQEALWASSERFHRTGLTFPLPLVAVVNGPALAGGFDLAVMCDLRVASTTAWFSHPELKFTESVYGRPFSRAAWARSGPRLDRRGRRGSTQSDRTFGEHRRR